MTDKPAVADQLRKLEEAFQNEPPEALQRALARAEGREDPFESALRSAEALLFASGEALSLEDLAAQLPEETDVKAVLARLEQDYSSRGVHLVKAAGKWRFQSAPDLKHLFTKTKPQVKKPSKAALECLGIIAYHQPVTRAEIEEIRGVSLSRGTLDLLLEIGWVRPRGRRRSPGRPLTYGTTDKFLAQFGLNTLDELPGKEDLKAAGLLGGRGAGDLQIPHPADGERDDEDPLEAGDEHPEFYTDHMDGPASDD